MQRSGPGWLPKSMGSDRSALGRPGCTGSCLSSRASLLPLLLVLLDCLGHSTASEDAEVYAAEVRTRGMWCEPHPQRGPAGGGDAPGLRE